MLLQRIVLTQIVLLFNAAAVFSVNPLGPGHSWLVFFNVLVLFAWLKWLHLMTTFRRKMDMLLLTCLSDVFSLMQGNSTFTWSEKKGTECWNSLCDSDLACSPFAWYHLMIKMFLFLTSEWSIEIFVIGPYYLSKSLGNHPCQKKLFSIDVLNFSQFSTIPDWSRGIGHDKHQPLAPQVENWTWSH